VKVEVFLSRFKTTVPQYVDILAPYVKLSVQVWRDGALELWFFVPSVTPDLLSLGVPLDFAPLMNVHLEAAKR
jgi:hypothetical protein